MWKRSELKTVSRLMYIYAELRKNASRAMNAGINKPETEVRCYNAYYAYLTFLDFFEHRSRRVVEYGLGMLLSFNNVI
jgi:hypothetical protein